jgi:hypothetical protein
MSTKRMQVRPPTRARATPWRARSSLPPPQSRGTDLVFKEQARQALDAEAQPPRTSDDKKVTARARAVLCGGASRMHCQLDEEQVACDVCG